MITTLLGGDQAAFHFCRVQDHHKSSFSLNRQRVFHVAVAVIADSHDIKCNLQWAIPIRYFDNKS